MRIQVSYEWCYETVDEDGDITDNDFRDNLSEFKDSEGELVLVRNEGNEKAGLEDRFWAYVKDGKLPGYFKDGGGHEVDIKVPNKFHKELKIYLAK
jgi:hypothetical protein